MIALLVVGALLVAWVVSRRRRRAVLAGRVTDKPIYSAEPPRRSLDNLKGQRL